MNAVYHKSDKGTEAIAARKYGLTPKVRSLLILVDGKRGSDELSRLSGVFGDTEQLLAQLLEGGFIEAKAAAPSPAIEARAPSAPATSARVVLATLEDAQRFAARRLMAILGPNSESLCLKIESTRTREDFDAVLARAESVIRDFRGGGAASQFASDMAPYRQT